MLVLYLAANYGALTSDSLGQNVEFVARLLGISGSHGEGRVEWMNPDSMLFPASL